MSVKCAIPKNDSAEKAVIAALLDRASVYRAPLNEAHFAAPDHQLVFRAVLDLSEAQQPVSIMSVRSKLESRGELENAGGEPSRFFDYGGGGDVTLVHHFPELESARRNREAVLLIHKHLPELTSLRIDAAQFAEELSQIAAPMAVSDGGDSVADIVADIEARELLGEKREFFTSGLDALDNLLRGGFVRGNLGVYAGRTGGGKSVGLVQSAVANAKVGRKSYLLHNRTRTGGTRRTCSGLLSRGVLERCQAVCARLWAILQRCLWCFARIAASNSIALPPTSAPRFGRESATWPLWITHSARLTQGGLARTGSVRRGS